MQKITITIIVLMVIGVGLFSGCSTSNQENKLKITSLQVDQGASTGSGSNVYMPYIATVGLTNTGSTAVSNAELSITLYKNDNIIDSQMKQLGNIGNNLELTEKVTVSDSHYSYESQYKVVATITASGKILDTTYMNL